ncbi:fumarylacetoacetate hydrolase family protein [Salmonella enterica subsp. enterica serovar Enteritidis]|nr:fumarylacetoacetate hydrolase family protein [Salmonella enterica subsp. enterica serovar Enteritidis]
MYQHRNWQGALLDYPVSKVVCVGSNYANHIKEMGSATPEEPVLFIKPETALCDIRQPLAIPADMGAVHHEVELAVLIGATLRQATEDHVRKAIAGYGVALDLTLRDIQGKMKKAATGMKPEIGHALSKPLAFSQGCPAFCGDPQNTVIGLNVNGEVRQQGSTADMIHPIVPLIAYMSRYFTLKAGDVVLTGTPAGVGPLLSGDELDIRFNGETLSTRVL